MEIIKLQFDTYLENIIITKYPPILQNNLFNALNGGKRIRPLIGHIFPNPNLEYLAYLEILHTISLILDDCPDMDNDTERRGKPTFHITHGLIYTKYFAFSIISLTLLHLSKLNTVPYQSIINELINLTTGQYLDLTYNNQTNPPDQSYTPEFHLLYQWLPEHIQNNTTTLKQFNRNIILNIKKTGALFVLATFPHFINQPEWGRLFGLIFQYTDDILDKDEDSLTNKPNICTILPVEIVKSLIVNTSRWLVNSLDDGLTNKTLLNEILDMIKLRC